MSFFRLFVFWRSLQMDTLGYSGFFYFQDPEVMAAFQDVSQNPANLSKYEDNPKVKKILDKLAKKFGPAGSGPPPGSGPGFPGGMPFGNMFGGQ